MISVVLVLHQGFQKKSTANLLIQHYFYEAPESALVTMIWISKWVSGHIWSHFRGVQLPQCCKCPQNLDPNTTTTYGQKIQTQNKNHPSQNEPLCHDHCSKHCSVDLEVHGGYVEYPEGSLVGAKGQVKCKPGFHLKGKSVCSQTADLVCTSTSYGSLWSVGQYDTFPSCEKLKG